MSKNEREARDGNSETLLLRLLGLLVVGGLALDAGPFLLGGILGILVLGLGRHGSALLSDGERIQLGHFIGVLQRIPFETGAE